MANSFQDLSQVLTPLKPTFDPQTLSATGAGRAVDVSKVGTNLINAQLLLGDAISLTSLAVKMQAAVDNGSGSPDSGSWVDIPNATFTTVTADPGVNGTIPETIKFQLPKSSSFTAAPYVWLRGYATLTGTSILIALNLLACGKQDGAVTYVNAPGNDGNNTIN